MNARTRHTLRRLEMELAIERQLVRRARTDLRDSVPRMVTRPSTLAALYAAGVVATLFVTGRRRQRAAWSAAKRSRLRLPSRRTIDRLTTVWSYRSQLSRVLAALS